MRGACATYRGNRAYSFWRRRSIPLPVSHIQGPRVNDIVGTLLEQRLLDDGSARLIRQSAAEGKPLDDAFLEVAGVNGADGLTEEKLLRFFSQQFQMPYVSLEGVSPPRELITRFPARLLLQHKLLPLED